VTNNKETDYGKFQDVQYWTNQYKQWYSSGNSFRALDSIEGRTHPIFQKWLQHPNYDAYWQNMIPGGSEFARINIPVLTTTGYYDVDQAGAFHYFQQHYAHNKNANHVLLIGPYDHGSAQNRATSEIMGYPIDSVANIDIVQLSYEWFDYVLKNGARPALLKNKINYQVMGSNEWRHAASLRHISNDTMTFYLSTVRRGAHNLLTSQKPKLAEFTRY
jgi:predicted acyl esterase